MKMWREVEKEVSEHSQWIERKKFCVFPFPGRSIRVVEMLKYRSYSVVFKPYEVPWFIEALREAGQVTFGAPFSKNATIGRRSMFLSIESNQAGVFIKMVCSFGGRNRRLLLIPAGEKGEGWLNLANLLAIISSGGDHGVKKPVVPSSNHRSGVKSKESLKEKFVVAEEWKEGFLPVFLKHGLELCVGAPSSSDEASRFFAWKRMQSELGCGLLVVEKTLRSGSPSNLTLACMDVSSGGEGFAAEDEEKEPRFLQAIDVDGVSICGGDDEEPGEVFSGREGFAGGGDDEESGVPLADDAAGVSILGNFAFDSPMFISSAGAPVSHLADLWAGGPPLSSGLAQRDALTDAGVALTDTVASRASIEADGSFSLINAEVQGDKKVERADSILTVADNGAEVFLEAENSSGSGLRPDICADDGLGCLVRSVVGCPHGPVDNGLGLADRVVVGSSNGLSLSPRVVFLSVGPRQVYGSGSSLANPFLFSNLLSQKANPFGGSDDSSFQARYEDIPIIDNEEELSLDYSASDSDIVEKEMSAEEGDSSPEEVSSCSEREQRIFNIVEEFSPSAAFLRVTGLLSKLLSKSWCRISSSI